MWHWLHVWGNCVRSQRVPLQVQCLHQLVSILAAMWNYSLLEKSPHILNWIHVRRAGRLKQDVGYSAIEKILLCLSWRVGGSIVELQGPVVCEESDATRYNVGCHSLGERCCIPRRSTGQMPNGSKKWNGPENMPLCWIAWRLDYWLVVPRVPGHNTSVRTQGKACLVCKDNAVKVKLAMLNSPY